MVTRELAGKLGDENVYYRYSITEFSLAYLSFSPFLKNMHSYVFKQQLILSIEATFIKNDICDLDEWKQAVTKKVSEKDY